jgi:hypothetical protein
MAAFTASAVIGSERTRAPEALKIALPSAGATTVTAGSPTPVAFSPLALPVHDAAYGGNSLLANGLTPTGPMPTLPARMIAFQSGGNANCELIERKIFWTVSCALRQ